MWKEGVNVADLKEILEDSYFEPGMNRMFIKDPD